MKKSILLVFLLIISMIQNPIIIHATPIFSNGFEEGDFTAWTGVDSHGDAGIVQNVVKNTGTYAAKMTSATWQNGDIAYKSITGAATLYARGYIQFNNFLGSDGRYFQAVSLATSYYWNLIGSAGIGQESGVLKWCVYYWNNAAVTIQSVASPTPAVNTWYCVEIKVVISNAGAGEVRVYVDGTEIITITGLTNNSRGNPTYGRFGESIDELPGSFANVMTVYVDDCVIDSSYIGPKVTTKNIEETVTGAITIGKTDTKQMGINRGSAGSLMIGKTSGFNKGLSQTINAVIDLNSTASINLGKAFTSTALISFSYATSRLINMQEIISRNIDINALATKTTKVVIVFIEENRGNLFYPVVIILLLVSVFILLSRRG